MLPNAITLPSGATFAAGTAAKQMMLVKVIAGKSFAATEVNRTLREPPAGCNSVRGNVRTNSVTCTEPEGGYMALMTYTADAAYPFYLLTYA